MKKTLLFAALLIGGLSQLNAQCTITPGCTPDPNLGYCTTPPDNTAITNAIEGTAYNTTIQLSIGTTAFGGAVTITSASLTSVSGLPAGLTYQSNPANGFMIAGSNACLLFSGTPSPGSAGSYTVNANFDIITSFGSGAQSVSWFLTVDPVGTVGIKAYNNASEFFLAPNPAGNELTVSTDAHFKKITIIDALGKVAISQEVDNTGKIKVDVSALTKGVYFLQANDGGKIITRKFIKD
jgi:hypothetical protein